MPDVRMPDGAVVRFPDDMGKDQIRSMISSKFPELGQPAQPQKSMIDMVAEKLPGTNALGEVMKFGASLGKNIEGGFKQGIGGIKQTYGELAGLGRAITNPANYYGRKGINANTGRDQGRSGGQEDVRRGCKAI